MQRVHSSKPRNFGIELRCPEYIAPDVLATAVCSSGDLHGVQAAIDRSSDCFHVFFGRLDTHFRFNIFCAICLKRRLYPYIWDCFVLFFLAFAVHHILRVVVERQPVCPGSLLHAQRRQAQQDIRKVKT